MVRVAIMLLTALSVLANAQCFGKCLSRACSENRSAPPASSCHHGGPPSHQKTVQSCAHLVFVTEDGSTSKPAPLQLAGPVQSFAVSGAVDLASVPTALAPSPPLISRPVIRLRI